MKNSTLSFTQFLTHGKDHAALLEQRLVYAQVRDFSGLRFMIDLAQRVIPPSQLAIYDLSVQSEAALKRELTMTSLLGPRTFLIMTRREVPAIDSALLTYLLQHQGTDKLWICSTNELSDGVPADVLRVRIEDQIDLATFELMSTLLQGGVDRLFVRQLFQRVRTLTLSDALLLGQYQLLVGRNGQQFLTQWLDRLVDQKPSLFSLSEYLFARDATRFYALWHEIGLQYVREFWVVYWSEQLLQALTFIGAASKEGAVAARKQVTRLPFSFMNTDWRTWSVAQLAALHDELYAADYHAKHGGIIQGLDIFYANMLMTPAVRTRV